MLTTLLHRAGHVYPKGFYAVVMEVYAEKEGRSIAMN